MPRKSNVITGQQQIPDSGNFEGQPGLKKKPQAAGKIRRQIQQASDKRMSRGWMVAGFDTSMSSIAGAAIGWDAILQKFKGPVFVMKRWQKDTHYFDRIKDAAYASDLVHELTGQMRLGLELNEIYIAQEEPWPPGMVGRAMSGYLKQQAEISGAFLGGLVRWGYVNVSQIQANKWRKTVADDLGITIAPAKWKDASLAGTFNCKPADVGKFRAKQWALMFNHGFDGWGTWDEIPEWEDIIESSKDGKVPRPDGSKAKAVQCDDRYEAFAMCMTHYKELLDEGTLHVDSH